MLLLKVAAVTQLFQYINIRAVRYKTHSRQFNYISEYIYRSLPLSRARSCDVRAARRSCPRAGGAAATETRWRSAQVERRRVEAMQRRKKRGARNSLPCALSCLKSNIHAEGGGARFRNDAGFSLAHCSGHRLGSLSPRIWVKTPYSLSRRAKG